MDIDDVLTRGVEQVLPNKEGLKSLMQARKIKLYQGFDPSMPSLHLGNMVGLMKLAQFQKLGHKVIFLVGDFSGMIGDPTDKLATRQKLSREQTLKNSKKWKAQASKFLDFEGENNAEILFNSKWLDKTNFKTLIEIASSFTVQQMIERDMFQERLKKNEPIYLHEFLYPVATAIDCVELDVDLEVGGSDQLFNLLIGRTLMKTVKNKEKFVLGTKLLIDKEGKKVGKTTGNALFLDTPANDFFGGIMSFPDEVIYLAFELLTETSLEGLEARIGENPMNEKKRLAYEITKTVHGEDSAKNAQEYFERTFQKRNPEFLLEIPLKQSLPATLAPFTSLSSTSEAKRLISQGSVIIDGNKITDPNQQLFIGQKVQIGPKIFGTITKGNDEDFKN